MSHDSLMAATAKENNQLDLLKDSGAQANVMLNDYNDKVKKGTITEVLKYINKPEQLKRIYLFT